MIDAWYRNTGKTPQVVIATEKEDLIDHFYKELKKFTPHFFHHNGSKRIVGRFNQTYKDYDVPILITTPQSLKILIEQKKVNPQATDLLFLDEMDYAGFAPAFIRGFFSAYQEGAICRTKNYEIILSREFDTQIFKRDCPR